MKMRMDEDGLVFSEVYSGIGIETDQGLFGIAQRDGGIEVLLDGVSVWSSADSALHPDERSLGEWQVEIHKYAVEKGWWQDGSQRNVGEMFMLIVTEVAEAMEEWRRGNDLAYKGEDGKPEGVAVELADVIIRVLDWAEAAGVNMGELVAWKQSYNQGSLKA